MKRLKKILAVFAIIVIAGMYTATVILAFMDSEYTRKLLTASLYITVVLPVLIYGMTLVYRVLKGEEDNEDNNGKRKHS